MENPIGALSSRYRKPDVIIHPWQYGHAESKATCLWLKNLPVLTPTKVVPVVEPLLQLDAGRIRRLLDKTNLVQVKIGGRFEAQHIPKLPKQLHNNGVEFSDASIKINNLDNVHNLSSQMLKLKMVSIPTTIVFPVRFLFQTYCSSRRKPQWSFPLKGEDRFFLTP